MSDVPLRIAASAFCKYSTNTESEGEMYAAATVFHSAALDEQGTQMTLGMQLMCGVAFSTRAATASSWPCAAARYRAVRP